MVQIFDGGKLHFNDLIFPVNFLTCYLLFPWQNCMDINMSFCVPIHQYSAPYRNILIEHSLKVVNTLIKHSLKVVNTLIKQSKVWI